MKVAIINGTMRHGSTWHSMDLVLNELAKLMPVERHEFFLPRDLPQFCTGCFSCFMKGENACPHAAYTQPIVEAILAADLIVLTSPVYALDVSGPLKSCLDHLCYLWMSHRPDPRMFNKIGLTVVTTAGAGLGHATKTMKNSLVFWCVKKVYSLKLPASAMKWSEVPAQKLAQVEKQAKRLAARIAQATAHPQRLPKPFFRSFLFKMMVGMQRKNDWNLTDRQHWEAQGWLTGAKPF
jgi:multimeric flavodoxin WrbA